MRKNYCIAFFIVEAILYFTYVIMDINGTVSSTPVKFVSILLVAVASLFAEKNTYGIVMTIGFVFTVLADVFLLVLNRDYIIGISFFLIVQTMYLIRLILVFGHLKQRISARVVPACIVMIVTTGYGLMTSVPAVYITIFAVNLIDSIMTAVKNKQRIWILNAIGMALFICCDICVGVHNLSSSLILPCVAAFASIAMWIFYLPGQILILSSSKALKGIVT